MARIGSGKAAAAWRAARRRRRKIEKIYQPWRKSA